MRIIISPAKKMNTDVDSLPYETLPLFLSRAEQLRDLLQCMSFDALKTLWKCNESIAALNVQRLQEMDLHSRLTPAILSYEGIQYRYMAPSVFTFQELSYIRAHLRILSGFYGLLRPFDGVRPYRLEMQAKLKNEKGNDLYSYWGSDIAHALCAESDCIVNLASKEYSLCVSRHLKEGTRFLTCVFGEETGGKVVEKGTLCKMARGEMVRFLAEQNISEAEDIKAFDRLGYAYSPHRSSPDTFVFLRRKESREEEIWNLD